MTQPREAWPSPPHDPAAEQRALAGQVHQTLALARALAGAGRVVDLAGLDRIVGLLCAKTLDLPPTQGQAARPALLRVLAELDALSGVLRAGVLG